ncbi:MAG: hypothetical protein ACHQJ6_05370 [Candidatus Berkiellales bacterium]
MKLISKLAVITLFPVIAFAEATSPSIPTDLIYGGKPIDPLCFVGSDEYSNGIIPLASCGISAKKDHKIKSKAEELIKKGFIGYDFEYPLDETGENKTVGSAYYKAFGKNDNLNIVMTIYNSGGTGEFTNLLLIKREGDNIQTQNILGGDRCNGGFFDMKRVSSTALTYQLSLTAFDFLTLANDNPHQLKAYDDLDSCAICCAASALYERKIGPDFGNPKLVYIDFDQYSPEEGSRESAPKYQACFDKLINSYKKKGLHRLNMEQLKEFTKTFNQTCGGKV